MEEIKKEVGRPRSNNPKMRMDLRLKTNTIIDIEIISEKLGINKSVFIQTIIENEMNKYKELLKL